ncbi:MAG TPA: FMN-binding protein, partial [Woeseiaceae bacterium]|nr:FMN-binding protein [Woeseiaceae bacterium]
VKRLLGHEYRSLRVRYWRQGDKTAWILDEIGKELPITIGVVVDGGAISEVRILEFREIRGWEVRYPFFTEQFRGAELTGSDLSTDIDGITGATLSVGAVTRVAKAALYLHEQVVERE